MRTAKKSSTPTLVVKEAKRKIGVSESNLRKAATRLLSTPLVTSEVAYVQRELGATATQDEVDAIVVAVRSMPWSSIVIPD